MSELLGTKNMIPATTAAGIERVREIEGAFAQCPQHPFDTHHVLHAGTYSRTVMIPAGVAITGAHIKVPTTLIVCGHVLVTIGEDGTELNGYHVFAAAAGRKQLFIAVTDTWLTMMFKTEASTIEEAEEQFTDEYHLLASRQPNNRNIVTITGE